MDSPSLYARPELAKHYLGLLLDRPQTALSLFGPRQIGKTTFIRKALISVPGDLLGNPARGVYVISDPIFALWLGQRVAQR